MKLSDRIQGVLALQPMHVGEIARCLSTTPREVRKHVASMDSVKCVGVQTKAGGRRIKGHPWNIYALDIRA